MGFFFLLFCLLCLFPYHLISFQPQFSLFKGLPYELMMAACVLKHNKSLHPTFQNLGHVFLQGIRAGIRPIPAEFCDSLFSSADLRAQFRRIYELNSGSQFRPKIDGIVRFRWNYFFSKVAHLSSLSLRVISSLRRPSIPLAGLPSPPLVQYSLAGRP
ncbi:hypothetical protein LINPERPRIM_LOCUS6325 [Linum perenne]